MFTPKKIIENLFGIKIKGKTNIIINLSILIFVALCFYFIPKFSKKQGMIIKENWSKSEFSGIVDSLSHDYANHAGTTIYLSNGIKKTNLPQHYYYTIKKDDSIYKPINNDSIFIKRQNQLIKLR